MDIKKRNIKIISIIITTIGATILFGWILNIEMLKSIRVDWPSTKPVTSVELILSGTLLYFLNNYYATKNLIKTIRVINILSLIVITLTLLLIFANFSDTFNVLGQILSSQETYEPHSSLNGLPSLGTLLSFLIIGVTSAIKPLQLRNQGRIFLFSGYSLIGISSIAIMGYIFDAPQLYYSWSFSSGMSLLTAIPLILTGIGFVFLNHIESNAN